MWYTYILLSKKDNKLYTGYTNNLLKRLEKHNKGEVYATKNREPFKLIYYEACHSRLDAFQREKYLKSGMGKRYIKNRLKNYFSINF